MDSELRAKADKAISRITHAAGIAGQMGNTLVLAYSGGKDSDVLLDLAIKSGVPFIVQHNHTTVDAPETVYHIREVFAGLRDRGIETRINYPGEIETVGGKRTRASMWNLIPKKQMPPTRLARYCCEYFKERRFDGQHIMTGVRWAESAKRKTRWLHEKLDPNPEKRVVYFDENDDGHKLMDICQLRSRVATNPIIDWTDADVWCCVKEQGIKMNPLYGMGFHRVGCVGSPSGGKKSHAFSLAMYPKYRETYLRTFGRMIEAHIQKTGTGYDRWDTPQKVMEWWTMQAPDAKSSDPGPNIQVSLFDSAEEDGT